MSARGAACSFPLTYRVPSLGRWYPRDRPIITFGGAETAQAFVPRLFQRCIITDLN